MGDSLTFVVLAVPEDVARNAVGEGDVMKDETSIVLTVVARLEACTVLVESGVVDTIEAVIVTVLPAAGKAEGGLVPFFSAGPGWRRSLIHRID